MPGKKQIGDFVFPTIPEGAATTIIPVPFPVTSASPTSATSSSSKAVQELQIVAVCCLAIFIWALPAICIKRKLCCRCFTRWISRRLTCYCLFGTVVNLAIISFVIAYEPDVSANDLFFGTVSLIESVSEKLMKSLYRLAILTGAFMAFLFRKRIHALLGFDQQLVRADLRDVMTCFAMDRFQAIEVSIWKMEELTPSWTPSLSSRSLFLRIVLGYNEPQHSRPHDGCTTSAVFRERIQLNYDPEDDTQRLAIYIKQQEVIGGAVSSLAPAAGALLGGAVSALTPLGATGGLGVGVVTGIGAANSKGHEVARVELSCSMINRIREFSMKKGHTAQTTANRHAFAWNEEEFYPVDLVPQGRCWLRISDVDNA